MAHPFATIKINLYAENMDEDTDFNKLEMQLYNYIEALELVSAPENLRLEFIEE